MIEKPARKLFAPPIYPDEKKTRVARLLNTVLLILIVATIPVYLTMLSTSNPLAVFIATSIMLLVEGASFALLHLGLVRASSIVLSIGLWIVLVITSLNAEGVSNVPFIALVLVVIIAGLLLGRIAGFVAAIFNGVIGLLLLILEINGFLPEPLIPYNLISFWISMNVIFIACAGLIYMSTKGMEEAIERAQQNERTQTEISRELQVVRSSLQQQVAERTQILQQRTNYLQASIEVSRATASILDTDRLMQEAVGLIREQFDLYYVGLFLLDQNGDWAVLRSGTGPAGKALLARGHRLRVGIGMIGWSIANAQPRVALEATEDAVRMTVPELPETRSEASIPLRSRGKILGGLSVQSERPNAFGETEISIFQALADQVGIALDNASLLQESRKALEDAQSAYGKATQEAWEDYLRSGLNLGYRYDRQTITPLKDIDGKWKSEIHQVVESGKGLQTNVGRESALFLPILVRDQVIGVVNFIKEEAEQIAGQEGLSVKNTLWTGEEIELLETIISQMGIAMDGARLYQDTQRLAFREQLTSEITTRIRETLDIETILRTAAQMIQKALGSPEVVISLGAPEDN